MDLKLMLFYFGCIPARILFIKFAITNPQLAAMLALIPIFGWSAMLLGYYQRDSGLETFGKPIWWKNLRPIHLLFYTLFAFNVFTQNYKEAIQFLVYDVIFGFIATTIHNFL